MMRQWSPTALMHARALRKEQTNPEILLWRILRGKRFQGHKFRRQQPIGSYVIDFYCSKAKLAIELDGGGHGQDIQKSHDERRTKFLETHGIRVLRFWNNQIFQETEGVLRVIYDSLGLESNSPLSRF